MAVSMVGTPVISRNVVAGETSLQWRSSSTPSISGMQMSDTTMSKICDESSRLAASPLVATSTLWPSLRKVISNNSQIDRTSSTISKWAIDRLIPSHWMCCFPLREWGRGLRRASAAARLVRSARKLDGEFRPLSRLGLDKNAPLMRLQNLIHDRQTQTRAAPEGGLERLEDLRRRVRIHAPTRVSHPDPHRFADGFETHGQPSPVGHGPQGVVAEVPKNLLHGVAVGSHPGRAAAEIAFEAVLSLGGGIAFEQQQRFFDQRSDVQVPEHVTSLPRIVQKLADDVVQALRLAADDLHQLLVVVIQRGH